MLFKAIESGDAFQKMASISTKAQVSWGDGQMYVGPRMEIRGGGGGGEREGEIDGSLCVMADYYSVFYDTAGPLGPCATHADIIVSRGLYCRAI